MSAHRDNEGLLSVDAQPTAQPTGMGAGQGVSSAKQGIEGLAKGPKEASADHVLDLGAPSASFGGAELRFEQVPGAEHLGGALQTSGRSSQTKEFPARYERASVAPGIPADADRYDDIIGLSHHTSSRHPRMPRAERAAQFSPFAALTGFGEAIGEAGRATEQRMELSEDAEAELSRRLVDISAHLPERPPVSLTCFVPDSVRDGGTYKQIQGRVVRINEILRIIELADGQRIPLSQIVNISSGDGDTCL